MPRNPKRPRTPDRGYRHSWTGIVRHRAGLFPPLGKSRGIFSGSRWDGCRPGLAERLRRASDVSGRIPNLISLNRRCGFFSHRTRRYRFGRPGHPLGRDGRSTRQRGEGRNHSSRASRQANIPVAPLFCLRLNCTCLRRSSAHRHGRLPIQWRNALLAFQFQTSCGRLAARN